ncbi:H-NS histone family protein [Paraburkholderia bryophila]|uniref:DNA-binding protein H-NS n=1 Tax=Paraburkholderia bryophila TaxID=420952 RepID=A0A329C7R9_9BURK|nr:H-NS histone family protein [Paraburkholderia bryophila]RAS29761.1 DNA-binding protein H-NS [Paraburkholderia bryophila]
MATLENLQAKIAKLQAQAEAIAKKQSSTVIAKIRELMEKHGLTTADIDAHVDGKGRGRKPAGTKVAATSAAAKYRHPKTGATWTGHGRAPAWIANVKDRSKFLTDSDSEGTSTTAKKVANAGNYVRGPQEPKYRDPKTGATWSGRGPAPAWLASAKDRTAFLIAGAGAAEQKVTVVKKVSAKKVAAKKVAAKKNATAAKKAVAKKVAAPAESPAQASSPTNGAAV